MPPDVRRQYESALQTLLKTGGDIARDAASSDVNISTQNADPLHLTSQTVTQMAASRIVVNGREYSRWEDVPAARAAFQRAGMDASLQNIANQESLPAQTSYQANVGNTSVSFNSSGNVTMGLGMFIVLLLLAVVGGLLIGWKFLH